MAETTMAETTMDKMVLWTKRPVPISITLRLYSFSVYTVKCFFQKYLQSELFDNQQKNYINPSKRVAIRYHEKRFTVNVCLK